MKIKTKISLGLIFLFSVILLIGGLGSYYLRQLANEAKSILKDNYETLEYTQQMLQALDEFRPANQTAMKRFTASLQAQEANVTETGEGQLTGEIRVRLEEWRKNPTDNSQVKAIRRAVYRITELNMQAIVRKNNDAQKTADQVLIYMALIGGICFIITFTFIFNFPGYIANPIQTLTNGIKQIANRNYDQRLHFRSNDEFGELAEAFNSMAEKLDEYEHSNLAKIIFEKKRIETIINQMQDAVIGLNEKRIILFANPVATQLLGLEERELVGKYAPDVASTNDLMRNLIGELMVETPAAVQPEKPPLQIYDHGKESFFSKEILAVKATRTHEALPSLIGQVIILKNITQYKELDAAKTNFIATISHELKTPIASIKMSTKLLADSRVGEVNPEQKRLIENIREDSNRLLKITGELLDLAQVETGNITLNFQPTPPKEMIDYALDAIRLQAEQKQIRLDVHVDPGLPLVHVDLEKTAWVLVNFLSNAVRYSPEEASIVVEARQEQQTVVFGVRDFGKGIEEQYREKIFERYFRVPNSSNAKTGTGLGLAISKEFITAQSGRIWVESELGEGCQFCFSLPTTAS